MAPIEQITDENLLEKMVSNFLVEWNKTSQQMPSTPPPPPTIKNKTNKQKNLSNAALRIGNLDTCCYTHDDNLMVLLVIENQWVAAHKLHNFFLPTLIFSPATELISAIPPCRRTTSKPCLHRLIICDRLNLSTERLLSLFTATFSLQLWPKLSSYNCFWAILYIVSLVVKQGINIFRLKVSFAVLQLSIWRHQQMCNLDTNLQPPYLFLASLSWWLEKQYIVNWELEGR